MRIKKVKWELVLILVKSIDISGLTSSLCVVFLSIKMRICMQRYIVYLNNNLFVCVCVCVCVCVSLVPRIAVAHSRCSINT